MLISGKKVVTLDVEDKDILEAAVRVLNNLFDALGEFEDPVGLEEIVDNLNYLRYHEPFEIDLSE